MIDELIQTLLEDIHKLLFGIYLLTLLKLFNENRRRHSDYSHPGSDALYNFLIGKC
jgi:hypothetical protein